MANLDGIATLDSLIDRFKHPAEPLRIVFMGSSNTQRVTNIGNAQNWVDWVDLGLSCWYGRSHYAVNVGISGQTTRDMLGRFQRDVAHFRPHVVFITAGGNDCNPVNQLSLDEFRSNLSTMIAETRKLGALPIPQTYYCCDAARMEEAGEGDRARNFPAYMQTTREVAAATGSPLIDHLGRWEALRRADLATYRSLMADPLHMSAAGHAVFAVDVLRALGADFDSRRDLLPFVAPALDLQRRLDSLCG